ncbi:hypothetical protein [Actinoplanes sp. NPDC026670]|uniref:hypothetical protein n=1 Tax=Actinoplanes sp. NPDC026670 TaxID=3154700 RepID=UPI0034091CEF
MRRIVMGVFLALLAGCSSSGTTAAADAGASSPSPSPSPRCDGVSPIWAVFTVQRNSTFIEDGGLNVLVIAPSEEFCPDDDGDGAVVISTATVRYGTPRSQPTVVGEPEMVAEYDGTTEVRVPIPVIGSKCLGVAVFVGTTIAKAELPPTGFMGVIGGPRLSADLFESAGGLRRPTGNLLGIDAASGPSCTTTITRE